MANAPPSVARAVDVHCTPLEAKGSATKFPESGIKNPAKNSPAGRDWNVFENSHSLRNDAATAAALAQNSLAAHTPQAAVAGISKVSVSAKSKDSKSSPDRIRSPDSQMENSTKHPQPSPKSSPSTQKMHNRHHSPSDDLIAARSIEHVAVCTVAPSVADLVAKFEAAASPSVVQKASPASRSSASNSDAHQQLSPRSSAVASASVQMDLIKASESAVKSGSSASVLQLYPQNAVWNHDSSTIAREIYADCTLHGAAAPGIASPKPSPKFKPAAKPSMRTPLKTTCADHAHTPVISLVLRVLVLVIGF
jgi:hypothetical protein